MYRDPRRPTASPTDEWIPLDALPPEVRARLEAMGAGESSGSVALRGGGVPMALYLVGACVIVLATLVAITGPSAPAFTVPSRASLLALAGLFAGAMFAARRLTASGRFAPPVFHVGPTCLLTLHAGHLRVIPAEALDVTGDHIARGDDLIDDGVHDPAWIGRLMAARSNAQTEPMSISRDPFRALAASPERVTGAAVRSARLRAIAFAAVTGALVGVMIEAGPLGIAGRLTARRENEARLLAEHDARERRAAEAQRALREADAARARYADQQRLAENGTEADARAWLRRANILDDPALKARIQARLDGFCERKYPARADVNDEQLLFVTMLRRACSDPEQSLHYMVNDAYATEGARLLTRHLGTVSEWLGVPLEVQPQPMQSPDGVHAYVEIEAVAIGEETTREAEVDPMLHRPGLDLRERVQPMRMTVRLHDRAGDLLAVPAFTERVLLVQSYR